MSYDPECMNTAYTGVSSVEVIRAKICDFEQQFNALKRSTREELESRSIDVKEVAECLTSLSADDMPEHKMFLKEHMDDLFQADSHKKLFALINVHYWNYLAYHLLEHLIKEFSVKVVKGEMEKYKRDLHQFLWDTPLDMFCQSQKKRKVIPPPGFKKLVLEFPWPGSVTLGVVEDFRQQYVCHYNLRECAMMLRTILPGSFTVVWYIPESIVEHLKKKVAEDILSEYAVSKLEIAGACVYKKVYLPLATHVR